jgi:hypothetical protein
MQLLIEIDGVFYDALTPFTVPSGVVNQQVYLQLNGSNYSTFSGSASFDVEVCNGAAAHFSHVFDFSLGTHSWVTNSVTSGTPGTWVPGTGWEYGDCELGASNWYRLVFINRAFSARVLTRVDVLFDSVAGGTDHGGGNNCQEILSSAGNLLIAPFSSQVSGSNQHLVWTGTSAPISDLAALMATAYYGSSGALNGTMTIKKITVEGIGTDPFTE